MSAALFSRENPRQPGVALHDDTHDAKVPFCGVPAMSVPGPVKTTKF